MRLDEALVAKSLTESLQTAQNLIDDRKVSVNGAIAVSYAHLIAPNDALRVLSVPKYVSRGGLKLELAIRHFKIDFKHQRVLDVGASTGGFTDCALQHGAREVVASDIGQNLLHEKLVADARVVVLENTHAKTISNLVNNADSQFAERFDIITVDVSFISLRDVLGSVITALKPDGTLVLLIKPQFEASKTEADKGAGIIKDVAIHERVCHEVNDLVVSLGCEVAGIIASPITGHDGNHEFLLVAKYTRVSP